MAWPKAVSVGRKRKMACPLSMASEPFTEDRHNLRQLFPMDWNFASHSVGIFLNPETELAGLSWFKLLMVPSSFIDSHLSCLEQFLVHLFSAFYILVMSWCRFDYYFCFNLSFLNCIFHIISRDLFHIVYVIGYLRGVFLGHDPLLLRIVSPSLRGKPCLLCNSL